MEHKSKDYRESPIEQIIGDKLHQIGADVSNKSITVEQALDKTRLVHLAITQYLHRPEMLKKLSVLNLKIAKI